MKCNACGSEDVLVHYEHRCPNRLFRFVHWWVSPYQEEFRKDSGKRSEWQGARDNWLNGLALPMMFGGAKNAIVEHLKNKLPGKGDGKGVDSCPVCDARPVPPGACQCNVCGEFTK